MSLRGWCNYTRISAHCPFHDGGGRFSCHLASPRYRKCVQVPPQSLDVCAVLAGRTIILVGDSLTEQHFNTLRCHACGPNCTPQSAPRARNSSRGDWTPLALRDRCTVFSGCGRICVVRACEVHSHYPLAVNYSVVLEEITMAFKDSEAAPIVVFNEGLWLTSATGHGNHAKTLKLAVSRAENLASAWAQHQSRSRYGRRVCVLWRETSPQDFKTTTGTYAANGAGWLRTWYNKAACASHANQTDSPWEPVHAVLTRGGIPLVRVWRASRLYFDQHLDRNTPYMRHKGASDCTHYCTPGPIDTWIDPLLKIVVDSCSRPRDDLDRHVPTVRV